MLKCTLRNSCSFPLSHFTCSTATIQATADTTGTELTISLLKTRVLQLNSIIAQSVQFHESRINRIILLYLWGKFIE